MLTYADEKLLHLNAAGNAVASGAYAHVCSRMLTHLNAAGNAGASNVEKPF